MVNFWNGTKSYCESEKTTLHSAVKSCGLTFALAGGIWLILSLSLPPGCQTFLRCSVTGIFGVDLDCKGTWASAACSVSLSLTESTPVALSSAARASSSTSLFHHEQWFEQSALYKCSIQVQGHSSRENETFWRSIRNYKKKFWRDLLNNVINIFELNS